MAFRHNERLWLDEIAKVALSIDKTRDGRHLMVYWTAPNGRKIVTTVPSSSSDQRAIHNFRADLRRAVKDQPTAEGRIHVA